MQIVYVKTKKEIKQFKKFRKDLYNNDPYYVSTIEFTCDMLLKKETLFAKSCDILPIMVKDHDKILAECILVYNPKDDFIQIAFFEALENVTNAVNCLKAEALKFCKAKNLNRIIVGLNGHLSYGVGLSIDIKEPNTFDSTYTKLYYLDYFKDGNIYDLAAFSSNIKDVIPSLKVKDSNITIRPINLKHFKEEMEIFRDICNETIGKTFLYSKTDKYHFEELMFSMTFFLKNENILFAEDKGKVVGFIFWHPDYNEILRKGKQNSLPAIAVRYIFNKHKIKKVKLNAIGVKENYQGNVTLMLLKETSKYIEKYQTIETNFVWENNKKSMLINKRLLKNVERRFKVVEYIYDRD